MPWCVYMTPPPLALEEHNYSKADSIQVSLMADHVTEVCSGEKVVCLALLNCFSGQPVAARNQEDYHHSTAEVLLMAPVIFNVNQFLLLPTILNIYFLQKDHTHTHTHTHTHQWMSSYN